MATAGDWSVMIVSENVDRNRMLRMSPTAIVLEVRELLYNQDDLEELPVLYDSEGNCLDDRMQIQGIKELFPGSRTVTLRMESSANLLLEIYKSGEERKKLQTSFSIKPEQLHDQVRQAFRLPAQRAFRLRTADRLLDYDRTLAQQNVRSDSPLQVDLAFTVDVSAFWTGPVRRELMYLSDRPADVLGDCGGLQRLLLGRTAINMDLELADTLPLSARSKLSLSLQHKHQKEITVVKGRCAQQRHVWPTDSVGKFSHDSSFPNVENVVSGKTASAADSFHSIPDLPDSAVLHSCVSLSVALSCGRRQMVRVPISGTAADIADSLEETRDFFLTASGRPVPPSTAVSQLLDADLEVKTMPILVGLEDRSVRWTIRKDVRFSELMLLLADRGCLKYEELLKRTLECCGCGRTLTSEREQHQVVPANCCEVRSLRLREPVSKKDAESQDVFPGKSIIEPEVAVVGRRPNRRGKKTQMSLTKKTAEVATQTDGRRTSICCQHPKRKPRSFFVWNFFPEIRNKENFQLDLQLTAAPTVGEIRSGLAAELGIRNFRLERPIGRHRIDKKVDVYRVTESERMWYLFVNGAGEKVENRDVKARNEVLNDDNEFFLVVPGWWNDIIVRPV